jgi:exosortase/archaeosortase family protein
MRRAEGIADQHSPGEHLSVRAFVLRFVAAFLVLEAFVYWVLWSEVLFAPYAELNARWSAVILGPFLEGAWAQDGYLMTPAFSIQVRPGCDSYQASAVLLAGIVAFPAPLARKLIGATVGSACLLVLNLLRLAMLQWTGSRHRALFESMHLEILPAAFVGAALFLLLSWALWARASPASASNARWGRTG